MSQAVSRGLNHPLTHQFPCLPVLSSYSILLSCTDIFLSVGKRILTLLMVMDSRPVLDELALFKRTGPQLERSGSVAAPGCPGVSSGRGDFAQLQ